MRLPFLSSFFLPPEEVQINDLRPGVFSVVRIIARMNVGGPARHVTHLTRELADTYPTLLVTGDTDADEAEFPFAEAGIPFVRVAELGRRIKPGQDIVALIKLVRILRRVRPDIVHTHTAKAGTLGRLAALLSGVPVRIHTFHGHVFEGYFTNRMTRVFTAIERVLARVTTRVIAISDSQAADLADRFAICKRERIDVIPLGLDLAAFRGADRSHRAFRDEIGAGGRFVVTSVGRLVPIKNQDLLLAAIAALADLDVMLCLVGGGVEEARLRRRAEQLGIADRVVFTGWRDDLASIYAGSDLVVLTSRNEGTPVCLLEAMAVGVPVAASRVGGVADVLGDGRHGTLFPSGDVFALAVVIRTAAAARADDAQLDATSRHVVERYSVARLVQDMSTLYGSLTVAADRPLPSAVTNRPFADAGRSLRG